MEAQKNSKTTKFGLSIAAKIALLAIQQEVAPASVVLSNLFALQKSNTFPKDLDIFFFSVPRIELNSEEKKVVANLLDDFKKPNVNKSQTIEQAFSEKWVFKKTPPTQKPQEVTKTKPKIRRKPVNKGNPSTPVVVIKKQKSTP